MKRSNSFMHANKTISIIVFYYDHRLSGINIPSAKIDITKLMHVLC